MTNDGFCLTGLDQLPSILYSELEQKGQEYPYLQGIKQETYPFQESTDPPSKLVPQPVADYFEPVISFPTDPPLVPTVQGL